ncbi:hypothetical protein [Actinocrispum wychmicini]|uniref:hypothetical protein n=1 Tax=Actinocrispum wychmicini TaxID=1213861 RepID=UPI00104828AF|nr:hypothetical protein [Actinocrispum wychmicini]
MEDFGVVPQRFEVLFWLAIFKLAYLSLCKAQPSPEKFLIERLTVELKMARVIPICLEDLTYMLALKGRPEFVGLKEFIPELSWWGAELVPLLSVTPAAQARRVVGSEHSPTALATATAGHAD